MNNHNNNLIQNSSNDLYGKWQKVFLKPLYIILLLSFSNIVLAAINIQVDVSPKNPAPGDFVMAKIIVTNTSNSSTGNIRVELPFPNNVNNLHDNALSMGGDCTVITDIYRCNNGETVFWDVGLLTSYQSVTLFLPPVISNGVVDGTVIGFNAQAFENNILQASSNQSVEVQSAKVLTLSINPNKHPVAVNDQLTYTLTYGHKGTITTTDTEVRFPLPASVSFVSADNGGVMNGGDVVWTIGSLFPDKGGKLHVTVQLEAGAVNGDILMGANATITGVANFINEQADANTATWVGNVTGLNFSMITNPSIATTGEFLPTQLIISNPSNSDKTGVRVELFYAGGLQDFSKDGLIDATDCLSAFGSQFYCNSGETIFWDVGTLNSNSSKVFFIEPNLTHNVSGEIIPFDARAFADNTSVIWQSNSVLVQSNRVLNLTIDTKNNPIITSSEFTYDLTYGHQGATATTSTELEFTIPDGTNFISASDNVVPVGNKVSWNIGLLNPEDGGKRQITLQLSAAPQAGDIIVLESATITGTANFQIEQTHSSDAIVVGDVAELNFSMQVNPNPAISAEVLPTQFIVSNRTNTLQTGVSVKFYYAGGLQDFSEAGLLNSGDCPSVYGSQFYCNSGETVVWNIGNLGPSGSKTLFIAPKISSTVSGDLIPFIAKVSADNSSDRWSKETIRVQSVKTLNLAIDASPYPASENGIINYDITFGHQGINATTGNTLVFTLPKDTSFVSASDTFSTIGDTIVWNVGTMNAGDGGKRQVSVQLNSSIIAGDIVKAEFVHLSGLVNTKVEQTEASVATWIGNVPQLNFAMTVNPNPAVSGEFVSTQLIISNKSNVVLTGVRTELYFAEGLSSLDDNALFLDSGNCTNIIDTWRCDSGETVFWDIGTLPPYGGKTISIYPYLSNATASGNMIRMKSRVFANGTSDLWQQTTVLVKDDLTLNIAIDSIQEPIINGADLTYNLTFANRGSIATTNTIVYLPIPDGTSFVSADADGFISGNDVLWDIGSLNPGEGSRRQAVFQLTNTLTVGDIITTQPSIRADDEQQAWTKISQRVRNNADLTLFLDLDPITLVQNDDFDADLTVENNTVGTMTTIGLDMYYPNYLENYNESLLTDGGDCLNIFNSWTCNGGETAFWSLGNILANDSQTIGMSPVIDDTTNPPPNGTVIQFFGRANNAALDEAFTSRSLLVGTYVKPPQPELDIFGNGIEIIDGDTTPTLADNTNFGSVQTSGATHSNTFVAQNTGTDILNLSGNPRVVISGSNAADFSITTQPAPSIAIGITSNFVINFNPSANGIRSANVTIISDDQDESPYTFRISGTGIQPEINITGNGQSISNNDTTPTLVDDTQFGSLSVDGETIIKTFTIENNGATSLSLIGNPLVQISGSNGFNVITQPSNFVAPGLNVTFRVRFDPSSTGLNQANISIANNDGDENPYTFDISGMGLASDLIYQNSFE